MALFVVVDDHVTGSMGEEPVQEVGSLAHDCSISPEEVERQRRLSAVYGQNRRLSLRCLPLAEWGVSN